MKIKIDKADQAFSLYIRTRDDWTCQRCGKRFLKGNTGGLECSHYFGRSRENTRFDPDNCIALCTGCHSYWDSAAKEEYRNFKIKQLGEKGFDLLMVRANTYRKKDRKMALIVAREMLKQLEIERESSVLWHGRIGG